MARRSKAIDIWRQMKPDALRRLALAVFLMFGVLGPVTILMESQIRIPPWSFIVIQTVAAGGMAASIILFARKRWWMILIIIVVWSGVMVLNSGGLRFVFTERGLRVELAGPQGSRASLARSARTLSPEELDAMYTRRGTVGILAIGLLAFGYAMFIKTIQSEISHRARLETEVNIARDIQQSLLPGPAISIPSVKISGLTLPASEVGGDFFDVVELPDGSVAAAIADVTGHGVGAGILSAMTKSALRSQIQHDASPVKVLENLNRTICQLSDEKTFVTFAYFLINSSDGKVSAATAGHPPILFRRSGAVERIRTASLALGLRPEARFTSLEFSLKKGDSLLLYTDGLLEAANSRGEQFGMERLEKCFVPGDPEDVCLRIKKTVSEFAEKFEDDVTIVCGVFS